MALPRLTPRQHQIADLICLEGLSVVAVARRLDMPIATARAHVRGIAQRLANPHGLPAYRLIQSYAPMRRMVATETSRSAPGQRSSTAA